MKRLVTAIVVALFVVIGAVVITMPVRAASQGAGFGTWAPTSIYGWHGSMLVDGVHTYCILPGLPAPTGATTDNGVSGSAAGLNPAQLTAINLLVTKYGQTDDPVQAASVGWAVKAIANWNETLHAFGYPGDSLQGAINWTFSALAPASNRAVQSLAAGYYAEATGTPAGSLGGSGSLAFTIDPADAARGTVIAHTDVAGVAGTVTLERAVFADTGIPTREGVTADTAYAIVATPPESGEQFRVRGTGTFRGGYHAAVRHFTTSGGQDTAGPAGITEFTVSGEDTADRQTTFAPTISTQVISRYVAGGTFVDDVTFASARGAWPRTIDGGYLPVSATGTVYRTSTEPVTPASDGAIPPDAEVVATLATTTTAGTGPTVPYRVESSVPLPGPGFYTAVWQIRADAQSVDTQRLLDEGYTWTEPFGEQPQIMMVSAVSSRAQPVVTVGAAMSDDIVVDGVVPAGGLDVTASVYRAIEGVPPADTCTPESLVFSSGPVHVETAGTTTITAPNVPDFGTYYWRERAVDAQGRVVHEGPCGDPSETTSAPLPTVSTQASASTGFGGLLTDVATVVGPIPQSGTTTLAFSLYRADDAVDPASACTTESLIGDTSAQPVAVTAEGDHVSPGIRAHAAGTYYWVERLWFTLPGQSDARLLAEGACGVTSESVVVETPMVSTVATERAGTGEPFTDTATVTGLGSDVEAELVFFVYRDEANTAACTSEQLLAETATVEVRGDGAYVSPEVRADRAGTMRWIAELRYRATPDADAVVLHRGVCGEERETTLVDTLAATGPGFAGVMSFKQWGAIAAGTAALGFGLIAIAAGRPRFGARPRSG